MWRKIVDQPSQWEARKRSLFWRDPQLTSLNLLETNNTSLDDNSRNLVAQCYLLERAWKNQHALTRKTFESLPLSLSFDSVHDRLALGLNDGSLQVYAIRAHQSFPICSYQCHSKGVKAVLLCLDYGIILTGSYDHSIRLWKLVDNTLQLMQTVEEHTDGVWDLQRDKEVMEIQPWVVSAGLDGRILLMRYDREKIALDIEAQWKIEKEEFTCVAICWSRGIITAGGDSGQVLVARLIDSDRKGILKHRHGVSGIAFLPSRSYMGSDWDGLLITASHDCNLRLWDIDNETCLAVISGHRDSIRSMDLSFTR